MCQLIIFVGGAVAIDLAVREEYRNKIWCVIVENTFTSIPAMAKVILAWRILKYFPLFFYKNKVNNDFFWINMRYSNVCFSLCLIKK